MSTLFGLELQTPSGSLAPALAASVALHVAVLAGVPDFARYSADVPRAPLNARLVPPDASRITDAPAPRVESEPERRAAAPVSAPARAAAPRPAPRPAAPQRAVAKPPGPAPVEPQARAEVAPAPPPPIAVAAAAAAAAARAEPAAAAGEPSPHPRVAPDAVDPGSIAQYRLALIGAARRDKTYPEVARRSGLEGRVAVELVIGADGVLAAAIVRRSSGHDVLDREALEMLSRAAARTPVPPGLQRREFRLDIPVLFELSNG